MLTKIRSTLHTLITSATTRVVSRIPSRPYPLTLSKTQANKGPQFKRTTEEYHLDENVQFDTKVLDSCWDERIKKWKIKIIQNKTVHDVEADVFINASGILKLEN
jgi:cation diffusion facilitator CzcD-associated flavoprotein CzcO